MKPIKLVFAGLHSYREEQSIDFETLGQYGLFGVFGPTGSGKSTILDAMTLALFGKIERATKGTQGIINQEVTQCKVDFSFSLAGKKYQAVRVYEKNKDHHLFVNIKNCRLYAVDEQVVLADKAGEMDKCIENLLGMEFTHFTQAVILPQGKFAQFLQLSPADRGKSLEHIFHLYEYGQQLSEKVKKRKDALLMKENILISQMEMLGDCSQTKIQQSSLDCQKFAASLKLMDQEKAAQEKIMLDLRNQAALYQEERHVVSQIEHLQKQLPMITVLEEKMNNAVKANEIKQSINESQRYYSKQIADLKLQEDTALALTNAQADFSQAEQQQQMNKLLQTTENQKIDKKLLELEQGLEKEKNRERISGLMLDIHEAMTPLNLIVKKNTVLATQLVQDITALEQQESTVTEEIQTTYKDWQQLEANYNALQKKEAALTLAVHLQAGEPCPVCGSVNHPHLAHSQEEKIVVSNWQEQEALVQAKKELWQKKQEQLTKITVQLKAKKNNLDQIQQQLHLAEQEMLVLVTKFNENKKQKLELDTYLLSLAGDKELSVVIEDFKRQKDLFNQVVEKSEEKLKIAESNLAAAKENSIKAINEVKNSSQQYEYWKKIALDECAEKGFATVNDAKKALLFLTDVAATEQQCRVYHQQENDFLSRYQQLQNKLVDYNDCEYQRLEAEFTQLVERREKALSQSAVMEQNLVNLIDAGKQWQQLQKAKEHLLADYKVADRLSKLLAGRALVSFLAREHLEEIVIIASATLKQLTSDRYTLELLTANKDDFMMRDNYNGGQLRSINTLSGGETFLVSLALALALSDKIQMRGAPLEFFFLDEGFGTLDNEKLELVMNTLERLPKDKGMVGIITHVPEVKNRLLQYLEVIPALDGEGSQLKMIVN